jgi:hypothetical protein
MVMNRQDISKCRAIQPVAIEFADASVEIHHKYLSDKNCWCEAAGCTPLSPLSYLFVHGKGVAEG